MQGLKTVGVYKHLFCVEIIKCKTHTYYIMWPTEEGRLVRKEVLRHADL